MDIGSSSAESRPDNGPSLMQADSKKPSSPTGYTFMCMAGMIYNIDGLVLSLAGIMHNLSDALISLRFIGIFISCGLGLLACFDLLERKARGRQRLHGHLMSQWVIFIILFENGLSHYFSSSASYGAESGKYPPQAVFVVLVLMGLFVGLPLFIATLYWNTPKVKRFLHTGLE
jgi:hypothetical protein